MLWFFLSSAWLSRSGKDNWDERCDVDGDGFVSGTDLTFLSVNWLRRSSATDLIYPGSRGPIPVGFVSDSVFDLAGEDFDDDFLSIDFLL